MGKAARGKRSSRLSSSIQGVIESLEKRVLMAGSIEPYFLPQKFITQPGGTLTSATKGAPLDIALKYLSANASRLGLTKDDLADPIVTDQYTDTDTGVTHIYLKQSIGGRPVENTSINLNITRRGQVLSVGGAFVANVDELLNAVPIGPPIPARWSLQAFSTLGLQVPADSVIAGSNLIGGAQFNVASISTDPIKPQLRYLATPDGLALTWQMQARTPDQDHWYDAYVDAYSGSMRSVNDWVDHASYNVLPAPIEAINDAPGGLASRAVLTDPFDPTTSPFGWHDTNGVAGAEFTDTRGNNVSAQEDADANNSGGFRPDGGASLNFNFPLDLALAPSAYQGAAVTNLFYWNNLLHDVHARYGFTELAGNFQTSNYTGSGLGADAVQADAQDGSGTNNANFATPPDGQAPRMQMYLFNNTSPSRDGDLSNEIITHEYGHGVSNRLTGGPANSNALSAVQSGGMGEGWSDWWGMMLTQDPTDTKTGAYPQGTYVLGQSQNGAGIRRFPYSFNMAVNPLTIANFGTSGTGGGATRSTEVHNVGEIWCSVLWDMNWLLIDKHGYSSTIAQGYDPAVAGKNGGNNLALQLVMDGLKLQPANPSFLQARDAILQADQVRTGGANAYQIWTAFARRGMGFSFVNPSSSGTSVTAAFDLPAGLLNPSVISHIPSGVSSNPISSLDITFSKAMDPASFNINSDVNAFTGPGNVNLKGSITGFTWTNSNQTLQLTFAPQTLNGQYTLNLGPQILAASDANPIDQNGNGVTGEAGDSYTASFRFDAIAGQVVSSTPANGTLVSLPLTSIDFDFNESFDPASISSSDLIVNQGAVSGVTIIDSNTARFTLSGIHSEGTLTLNIAAGAIADTGGNPMLAYSGSLALDAATVPFPSPLAPRGTPGMMIYDGATTATIGSPADTDTFTLSLDAGQRLTLLVRPGATLRPNVELRDPSNTLIASASGNAVGIDALIQSAPITAAGMYTITVSSVGGASSGSFSLTATLNASLEAENYSGPSNDTIGTAQNLNGSFNPLLPGSSAMLASVLGKASGPSGLEVYSESFESGTLGAAWSTYKSDIDGRIQVTNSIGAAAGAFALTMDTTSAANTYNLNEAIWTVNLSGVAQPTLKFSTVSLNDETTTLPSSFSGHFQGDGVSISVDGVNWKTIWSTSANSTWTSVSVNLATAAAAAGITLGSSVQIKFQQYDNFAMDTDGRGFDAISITTPASAADYYALSLATGERLTVGGSLLAGSTGNLVLTLFNPVGVAVAYNTTSAVNFSQIINSFVAPTDGTYYVLLTANQTSDYALSFLRNGVVDIEVNNTVQTAQPVGKGSTIIGAITPATAAGVSIGLIQDVLPWASSANTTVASALGYTTTLIPSGTLATVDLSKHKMILLAGDQMSSTYLAVQQNMSRIETYVAGGGIFIVTNAQAGTAVYSYDLLPGIASPTFTYLAGADINILNPASGLITGPGGTITNTSLDNGNSSDHGYTESTLPAGASAILSTGTPTQIVALDYPYGAGRVITHTVPVEFYGGSGAFGNFHKNLFSFGASFVKSGSDSDYYSVTLAAGDAINLETSTPGAGAGEFTNTLDPAIELFNPAGALVGSNDNGSADGRNASMIYVAPTAGNYVIRVTAAATSGEYVLTIKGSTLRVDAPRSAREDDGVVFGTLNVVPSPTSDLIVALTSSDPTRLSVPATITIPAGQNAVPIPLTLLNNTDLDGASSITVSASAVGYGTVPGTVLVHDDETAVLTVTLPASAVEGNGAVAGTVHSSIAPTRDVIIQLQSSKSLAATVPATITLPAGQTSVNFALDVVNNSQIDGTQAVTITAAVENWTSGAAGIDIADDDATITLQLPPGDAWEGQTLSGKVIIGGTINTDLVVYLASSDLSEMGLPASVTILAGRTEASFTITLPGDGITDGAQLASISADASGLSSATTHLLVHDADLHRLVFAPIAGAKTGGVSFAATARAYNIDNEVVVVYAGSAALTASGLAGTLQVTPASATFNSGVWSGDISVNAVDPAVTLGLTAAGVSGASNVFAVEPGPVTHFQWSAISTPQIAGIPFPATVLALDAHGFVATSFDGPVTFTGRVSPSTIVPITTSGAAFLAGVWTGQITVLQAALSLSLHAQDGASHVGSSGAFNVIQRTLSLVLPADVRENDGSSIALLNVSPAPASDLVVTLTNSHPTRLGIPGTITVPAGQTSVAVPISILNNGLLDGLATVSITAAALTYSTAAGQVRVHDNETAVLSLSLPATATEGSAPLVGTVTVSDPAASDVLIQLTSSNPGRGSVPASVLLPAGQTSVTFPLTLIDNTVIDGVGLISVTASVEQWVSGFRSVLLSDNDNHLRISLPPSASWEGKSFAGSVSIGGTLPEALLVDLSSSSPGNLSLPVSVIIPAGQTSASFTVTPATDSISDGLQSYSISASANDFAGITGAAENLVVHDSTLHHFGIDSIAGPKTAMVNFSATAVAKNIDDEQIVAFNGLGTISATGQSGVLPISAPPLTFSDGTWTGAVAVNTVDPAVTLRIDGDQGVYGISNAFIVQAGAASSFEWSPIASTQYTGSPISATITARDANGFIATGFSGATSLRGTTESVVAQTMLGSAIHGYIASGSSTYTLGYSFVPVSNISVTHVRSYFGNKVSIWSNTGTLLSSTSVTSTPGAWKETPISAPITLQAGTTYRIGAFVPVGLSYYGSSALPTASPVGTISQWLYSLTDGLPTTSISGGFLVDLRGDLSSAASIPITPGTADFTNGVWSGSVAVSAAAISARLHVDDGAGHTASSNAFNVLQRNLTLNLPSSCSEAAGIVNGTVTVDAAVTQDTVITLTSTVPTRVSVPATVTIPAGQTSATVPITIVDNSLLTGDHAFTITANAAGATSDAKLIIVEDDELGVLSVNLPAGAAENAGSITGTITSSLAPATNLVILLSSSNTGLVTAPYSVTMPAGQTSVSFTLAVINNNQATANPAVTITASGETWIAASGSIDIADEDSFLRLTLPDGIWEGHTFAGAARVTMGGVRGTNTVIDLTSSDLGKLNGPSTVTILAGQTSATFTVSAPTDDVRDGRQDVQFSASAIGLSGATAVATIHDVDLDHFSTGTIPSPRTASVAFGWSASAMNLDNEVIPFYNGTATIAATGAAGTLASIPAAGAFINGAWSGNVKVDAIDPAVVLSISNGAGISTASNSFATVAGALTHYAWASNPGTQMPGVPFNMTIIGKDANGYTADYDGPASLSGLTGIEYVNKTMLGDIDADRAASAGTNTYGYSFTPAADMAVTHFRSYFGTRVSLWTNTGTLLATSAVTGAGGSWVETPLATPVNLLAGVTYRIGAFTGGQLYRFRIDMPATTPIGTINQSLYAPGNAFPNSAIALQWAFVDLRTAIGNTVDVPITPNQINLVHGVWSGAITVPGAVSGMHLTVRDASGRFASTANFDVAVATTGAAALDPSSDSGALHGDGVTRYDNTSPSSTLWFTVPGTIVGATVRLYANGVLVGSALADGASTIVQTDGSTGLPDGSIAFTARQVIGGNESSDSPATTVTIDSTAPAISGTTFDFETRPAVRFDSDEPLTGFSADSLALINLSTGETIPASSFAIQSAGGRSVITFPGFASGILPDGAYQLTIPGAALTDLAGNTAADQLFNFFVLGGDANRDGKVDIDDLYILSSNYLRAAGYSQGDFNYDGKVDSVDLTILAANWQKTLPPPLSAGQTATVKVVPRRTPTRMIQLVP